MDSQEAESPMGLEELRRKLFLQERLQEITTLIHSARDLNEIFLEVRDKILEFFEADRITIYGVDARANQIFSKYKQGTEVKEIRLPIDGQSLAGFVAMSKKPVNISDAYDEAELSRKVPVLHFDKSWDQKTGFRTKQVLAVPIVFKKGGKRVFAGVVQLMNKRSQEAFTEQDQKNLETVAEALGIAFTNQKRMLPRISTRYDQLLERGLLKEEELDQAIGKAKAQKLDPELILMTEHEITREDLLRSLGAFYGCGYLLFEENIPLDSALMQGIRPDYLMHRMWVPVCKVGEKVLVLVDDPKDLAKLDEIRTHKQLRNCEIRVALKQDILKFIQAHLRNLGLVSQQAPVSSSTTHSSSTEEILSSLKGEGLQLELEENGLTAEVSEADSSVVRLANQIIREAFGMGASDIHIEPYGRQDTVVRLRVDGLCMNYLTVPANYARALVARYKIMASLDIAERRRPQDGKIKFHLPDREIELRVATLPTAGGNEDLVMRILAAGKPIPLEELGLSPRNYKVFLEMITKPYGMVLVVGPTGSGKSTTLHSALGHINTPERKIWTAEDPVEITQKGLRQVQVHPKIGLTFAAAMRSFLRADPDVIMVGEMRDRETAEIAIEASLTGHLVLSTLHTNSAPETITRLLEMGMDPFNFADSLLGVLAQRLVRTICQDCKIPYHPSEKDFQEMLEAYGASRFQELGVHYGPDLRLFNAKGCEKCHHTGYRGRMAIHELLVATDSIKEAVQRRAPVEEIRRMAMQEGMSTLLQDGIAKVLQGFTDLRQVKSVCMR
ncbi:MAG: GspE/PulE family protein [bacterium]